MKTRKPVIRTCVVTHEPLEKHDLIRIVRTPEGNVVIDTKGKQNGRGAYLKRDLAVVDKAKKSKILDRKLEIEVPENIYDELKEIISAS